MIYGVGTDIVQISRMQSALERHGERFAEKILGIEELAVFRLRGAATELRGIRYLATRFAAKEAFSKAIGTGMQLPMSLSCMQTLNASSGQPVVALSGALKEFMVQNGLTAQVSISDESEYALAFVVVEKIN